MHLQPGDAAPNFDAWTDQSQKISLRDFRGQKVILYFYPEDDTPGCTRQACGFRDQEPLVKELNAVVLGVSPDSMESHVQFKKKYGLPFTLLVDADHAIAQTYGVWQEKSFFGLIPGHINRSHFVVDEHGKIISAEYKISARDSVSHALQTLREG
ncbi:MAG: thioredoxin-dependent thiol peroxidase [bacterium]